MRYLPSYLPPEILSNEDRNSIIILIRKRIDRYFKFVRNFRKRVAIKIPPTLKVTFIKHAVVS
jgi:hypothetical protein